MVELTYIGLIAPDDSGRGFVMLFPDVFGCICEGQSVDEVMGQAASTLATYLMALEEEGGAMPIPRTFDELMEDGAWQITMERERLAVVAVTLEADVTLH